MSFFLLGDVLIIVHSEQYLRAVCAVPLEGLELLAQETLQVENLLHEKTLDSSLLSAGGVDPLRRLSPHQNLVFQLCRKDKKKTNREFSFHPRLKWAALFWEYARGRKPLPRMDDVLFFNTIKIVGNKVLTMVLIHLWGWERSSLAVYSISFYIFKCIPHAQSLFKAFFTYLFLVSYWTQEQWEAGNGDADAVSAGPFALQQTLMISDA